LHPIGLLIVAIFGAAVCAGGASIRAQEQDASQHPQDFSAAYLKADTACKALWADHAFDPLRDKVPLAGQKPTVPMLTNRSRLVPKDRPLADLAIKTLEKCRALQGEAIALLPQQTRLRLQGFDREQDSLIARLYSGKITIGDYNIGMNRLTAELFRALYGDVQSKPSETTQKQLSRNAQPATAKVQGPPIQSTSLVQKPVALVIGNSNYKDLPKLTNPARDARAIVDALRELGFDVTLVTDASELNIRRAVRKFADQSGQADFALVYYAGHGAQVNGENYLLPVDMEIPHTEADIELSSLKVDDLVNSIRSSTKIIFLDACRDNPALFKNLVKGRGGAIATGLASTDASHLARIKPGGGVFIAYATEAGSVALDGQGEHSPFTQALLRNVKKPLSIDDMFSLVTREVALVTKGMQRPYKYASLENIVCLTGTCSDTTQAPTRDIVQEAQRSDSDELQIALQTKTLSALESYLGKYPESSERQSVLNEIGRLKRSEFDEWTLFEISNLRYPHFMQLSSIQKFGDRASVSMKYLIDPSVPPTVNGMALPDAAYVEAITVFNCRGRVMAIAEHSIFNVSGELLYHYKWADPQYLNLSISTTLTPGSTAVTAREISVTRKTQLRSLVSASSLK
jgi:hypothetical protein